LSFESTVRPGVFGFVPGLADGFGFSVKLPAGFSDLFEFDSPPVPVDDEFVSAVVAFTSRVVSGFFLPVLEFDFGFLGLSEIISSILSESSWSVLIDGGTTPFSGPLLVTTRMICPVLTVSPGFGSCSITVPGGSELARSALFVTQHKDVCRAGLPIRRLQQHRSFPL